MRQDKLTFSDFSDVFMVKIVDQMLDIYEIRDVGNDKWEVETYNTRLPIGMTSNDNFFSNSVFILKGQVYYSLIDAIDEREESEQYQHYIESDEQTYLFHAYQRYSQLYDEGYIDLFNKVKLGNNLY